MIFWLPHAGNVEIFQVLLAAIGVWYGANKIRQAWLDRRSMLRYGTPIDRITARANMEGEIQRAIVQCAVLAFGIATLFLAPPPPSTVSLIMTETFGKALLLKQLLIIILSFHLMWRSRRDLIARRRIMAFEAEPGPDPTLFDRLGGAVVVDRIVADLYARLLRDQILARYFDNASAQRLIHAQAKLFEELFSGRPLSVNLRETHAGLRIPPAHFERFVDVLRETLVAAHVPARLGDEIVTAVFATRDQIVTRGA